MDSDKARCLTRQEQTRLAVVGLVLVAIMAATAYVLARMILVWPEKPSDWDVVALASIAGLVGGSTRSLFMFVREIGGHGEFGPAFYYTRWFLYLFKPALGSISGPLLLLAVTKAVVPGFIEGGTSSRFNLPLSLVVATTGGIFFEEAFAFVSALVPSTVTKPRGKIPPKAPETGPENRGLTRQ